MNEFDNQIAALERNAASILDAARSSLKQEFASIDRAHDIKNANRSTRAVKLSAPTIHDLCANNPVLRKIIRDMQR